MTPHELKDWLQDKPREFAIAMAFRSAARVLPLVVGEIETREKLTFTTFRCLLISSVAALVPTDDIKVAAAAARAAARAVRAARASTDGEAGYAALAASAYAADASTASVSAYAARAYAADVTTASAYAYVYAANARASAANAATARASVAADAAFLDAHKGEDVVPYLLASPLWPQGDTPLHAEWSKFRARLEKWQGYTFWIDWYDGLLQGRAQNWDMLRDIALIEPDIWDEGAEAVAVEIAKIQVKHLGQKLPRSDRPSEDKLSLKPQRITRARQYSALMQGVTDACDDVKAARVGVSLNSVSDLDDAVEKTDRALARDLDDPNCAHDGLYTARARVRRYLNNNVLPEDSGTKLNRTAQEFDAALTKAMRGIRKLYPEVAEMHALIENIPTGPLPDSQGEALTSGAAVLGNAYGEQDDTSLERAAQAAITPPFGVTPEEVAVIRYTFVRRFWRALEQNAASLHVASVETATQAAPILLAQPALTEILLWFFR